MQICRRCILFRLTTSILCALMLLLIGLPISAEVSLDMVAAAWLFDGNAAGMLDEFVIFDAFLDEGDVQDVMNNGLETNVTAVDPKAKLATTWGNIKQ